MNTAEAIAAALYICGYESDARVLLYPFSYGEEFIKINHIELEQYVACKNESQVADLNNSFVAAQTERKELKERKKELEVVERGNRGGRGNIGGYLDESLLPPTFSEDEGGDENAFDESYLEVTLDAMGNVSVKETNTA